MFERILVPIDGSPTARQAIDKALVIAEKFGSTVTLVYVIDPYAFTGVGTDFSYGQTDYLTAATTEAHETLGAASRMFEERGIAVKASVIEGHTVYTSILDAAKAHDADLIVMGSHGRRGLQKLVLGSVTSQVLANAHIAVLVTRQ